MEIQEEISTALNAEEKLLLNIIEAMKQDPYPWIVVEKKSIECQRCRQRQNLPKERKTKDVSRALEKFVERHSEC